MPLITNKTGLSPALLNALGIFQGTGADIAALGVGSNVKVAYCSASSSGFLADHIYFRRLDNTWQVLNLTKHDHAQDDDDSGGLYKNIRYNNRHLYYSIELQGTFDQQVYQELSSNALIYPGDGAHVTVQTGSTATNYANIKTGGRRHNWDYPSRFDIKCRTGSGSQLVARAGCHMESLIGGNDVISKYGIEFCDSTGSNWQIVSASGTVRSIQTTTYPGFTSNSIIYSLEHTPGGVGVGQVKLTTGLNPSPFVVKTSDPPHSMGGADYLQAQNTVSAGIKTNDGNNKQFFIFGIWFEGVPDSNDGNTD